MFQQSNKTKIGDYIYKFQKLINNELILRLTQGQSSKNSSRLLNSTLKLEFWIRFYTPLEMSTL